MSGEGIAVLILSPCVLLIAVRGDLWSSWQGMGIFACWIVSTVVWARNKYDWRFCEIYDSLCQTHAVEPKDDEP